MIPYSPTLPHPLLCPEDAVVHLAVRLHILPEILAEVARQAGDWDMWAAKNMFRVPSRCHKDIKSRLIKMYNMPFLFYSAPFVINSNDLKPAICVFLQNIPFSHQRARSRKSFVSSQHSFFQMALLECETARISLIFLTWNSLISFQ